MIVDHSEIAGRTLGIEGLLGLLALSVLLVGSVFWSARGPRTEKTDFALTYMGATIFHRGEAARLYDREFQVQTRESLFTDPNPLLFEHPPFEALLLSPLAKYPFRTVYLIWGLLNATAWIFTMVALRPYCPWPRQDLAYVCLWPLFAPLGVALFQGQTSILVLGFFSAGFVLLRKDKEFAGGLCFGLALLKLQVAVPLLLIFLFRKRWKVIGGAAITASVFVLLSVWAVGVRGLGQYASFLLSISRNPRDLSYGSAVDMGSIYGFTFALLGHMVGHAVVTSISVVLSILLLWFVAKRWNQAVQSASVDLAFAAAIAASIAAGNHVFTHDFSPLMLALLLGARHFLGTDRDPNENQILRSSMRALLLLFWAFPLYFVLVAWHCLYALCPFLVLFAVLALNGAKNTGRGTSTAAALATSG